MPEDFSQDESPSLSEALDDSSTEDVIDDTSSDTGLDDDRSEPAVDDEKVRLAKEVDDLKQRVAHGTRTAQQMKQLEQELATERQRVAFWKQHGVDAAEIDRLVREKAGVSTQPPATGPVPTPEQITKVLNEVTKNQAYQVQWDDYRDDYCDKHPEFDSKEWKKWMDFAAQEKVDEEKATYGHAVTKPRQMLKYVIDRANAMRAKATQKAVEEARQTRTKVNAQGVTEAGTKKRRPGSAETEESEFDNAAYAELARSHTSKIRSGAPRK